MAAQGGSMTVIRWVLDTRPLWPEAQKTKDLTTAASDALAVLSDEEREQVLRFYFVKDAKLALGSALLKRLAISRLAGVAWADAAWTRDERTKPMTGDALLAPWLRDLEMRYFAPPGHVPPEGDRRLEIWFRGRRVDDVHMRLEPLLRDYMLCTAVRCGSAHRAFFEAQVAQPATILTLQEIMAGAQAGQKS
ncbi:hypothetical protein HIM_04746 [Hirsutella minnesotensis 3608]|uniref:4'-phosphopantetheinyl transferase N-terminal domain-containing protein n=1 Tax=Hirsutella minnesotensis 3608 TaxID=1043627 RepID=A0A0F8A161_9HYPO|nr:hypothetical protein HIM_04746 [Hirsutella minnesotensis 3608]